jgi:hypothetical protein
VSGLLSPQKVFRQAGSQSPVVILYSSPPGTRNAEGMPLALLHPTRRPAGRIVLRARAFAVSECKNSRIHGEER